MATLRFSTSSADYALTIAGFLVYNHPSSLVPFDAVVTQTNSLPGNGTQDTFWKVVNRLEFNPPTRHLLEYCQDHALPLFSVCPDTPPGLEKKGYLFFPPKGEATLPERCWIWRYGLSQNDQSIPSWAESLMTWQDHARRSIIDLEDAVAAQKIEQFIVPSLTQDLQRRPKIQLVYPTLHVGLKRHLQSPAWREETLDSWLAQRGLPFDPSLLTRVVEMRWMLSQWRLVFHDMGPLGIRPQEEKTP